MGRHSASRPATGLSIAALAGAIVSLLGIAVFVLAKNTSDWAMAPAEQTLPGTPDPGVRTADTYHLFGIPMDFQVYYRAGECLRDLRENCDVYAQNFHTENNGQAWDLPFTYPPFAAWFLKLLARLPLPAAAELWQVGSLFVLGMVIAAVLRERHVRLRLGAVPVVALLVVAAFVFAPVRAGFFWGQVNVFVMGLIAVDFLALRTLAVARRKGADPWWAGIGVGLAAGIKLFPAFFGFLFLLQRRFRAAAVAAATFILSVAGGAVLVRGGLGAWLETTFDVDRFGGVDNPTSQSLKLWLQREARIDSTLVWLVLAVAVAALTFASARSLLLRHNVTAAVAVMGIGMSLVSPFSWHHYWLWIVPLAVGGAVDGLRVLEKTVSLGPVGHFAAGITAPFIVIACLWPFVSVVLGLPFDIWGQIYSDHVAMRSAWILWSLLMVAAPWIAHLIRAHAIQPATRGAK